MNFDKIDEIQITLQFSTRWLGHGSTVVDAGCWVLDTAVVDVDTGVWRQARQRRRRHRGQESCSGHPPTVAVAAALRELRGKYASINYLTTF